MMPDHADETSVERFLQLKMLNQISIRSYYQFYAAQQALAQQDQTWFKFIYSVIVAVIASATSAISLAAYFAKLDTFSIGGTVVTLALAGIAYPVYARLKPSKSLGTISDTVRLAIHLDQIQKQSVELSILARMSEPIRFDDILKRVASEDVTILTDSVRSVDEIVKDLGPDLHDALEDIHITKGFLDQRLELGKCTLRQFEDRESTKSTSERKKNHDFPPPAMEA